MGLYTTFKTAIGVRAGTRWPEAVGAPTMLDALGGG